jgi:3-deoxy-D-manno-octulosonate 8-phosphate phosphatase KdsC-like HAD superfamily phosphatase
MKVKKVISDVDGTVTDGCMHYNETGYLFKRFEPHINSGLHLLKKMDIPIEFFTSGRRGYKVSEHFANMFEVDCTLVFPLEERIQFVKRKYEEIKDVEGVMVYLGDSDWDEEVIRALFPRPVKDFYAVCPRNATRGMKNVSNKVMDVPAGEGFFYETIYYLTQ